MIKFVESVFQEWKGLYPLFFAFALSGKGNSSPTSFVLKLRKSCIKPYKIFKPKMIWSRNKFTSQIYYIWKYIEYITEKVLLIPVQFSIFITGLLCFSVWTVHIRLPHIIRYNILHLKNKIKAKLEAHNDPQNVSCF